MQASKELWEHALLLKSIDKESFEAELNDWYIKSNDFIKERKVDLKGKNRSIHKKLRSPYRSLVTN